MISDKMIVLIMNHLNYDSLFMNST